MGGITGLRTDYSRLIGSRTSIDKLQENKHQQKLLDDLVRTVVPTFGNLVTLYILECIFFEDFETSLNNGFMRS